MVDCKGGKNLFGFAVARPPCVVFIVCLAAFAIGLYSLGCFIKTYGWFDTASAREEKWGSVLGYLSSTEFCIFGNQSFSGNTTGYNSTNITDATPTGFTTVTIPILHLALNPLVNFSSVVENVTHVTAQIPISELGLKGFQGSSLINVTFFFHQPWFMDCQDKCRPMYLEACGFVTVPSEIVPKHLQYRRTCNRSSEFHVVEMVSITTHEEKLCFSGIKAETSLPLNQQHATTATMTLVDVSAVNLRLQYSSYFLFVMVITCVLYGMIKGRPVKQSKKSNLPL